jgi:hypothetical protein
LLVNPIVEQQPEKPIITCPDSFIEPFMEALSHYPELQNTSIKVVVKEKIKSSMMLAQPGFSSLFKPSEKRSYLIKIARYFKTKKEKVLTSDLPKKVLTGWFAHELGHILDYSRKSGSGLAQLGIRYVFSRAHVKRVEKTADSLAVLHGMQEELQETKEFILTYEDVDETYREKIEDLYPSPDDIVNYLENVTDQ